MNELEELSNTNELGKSLLDSFKSLSALIQAAYKLAPFLVILLILLAIPIIFLTSFSTGLMKSTAVLLVLIVSLGIFIARNKFGEALFSVIGGLIAILRIDWTVGLYVSFWAAWLGFSLFSLLISSIKLAAKYQDIVLQSAIFANGKDGINIPDRQNKIELAIKESRGKNSCLKPVERAELARFFIFRGFSTDVLSKLIYATDGLFNLSKVNFYNIASCVADIALTFKTDSFAANSLSEPLFLAMKDTCATPEEFFEAFRKSRKFLINEFLGLEQFVAKLVELLNLGLVSSEIYDELEKIQEQEGTSIS